MREYNVCPSSKYNLHLIDVTSHEGLSVKSISEKIKKLEKSGVIVISTLKIKTCSPIIENVIVNRQSHMFKK